ncbi:VanZ family protein [Angulomicrobium tetraedrale]|uniref:VanZ family protein n=1 Tax=Ancylobacter tetraedralis TaxID=217068 RepID=A0A839Z7I3_9HYPH|nr:hypothetical protein [Ancylobacter tetraedralis]MBB3770426.1 VanZ family protein [Ancylobacter tetraedralis]
MRVAIFRDRAAFTRALEGLARLGALACLIALPLLALLPAGAIERTGAGKNIEHFIAYCGTGALLCFGLATPRQRLIGVLGLIALAGALEYAQSFTATRSSELAQFIASSIGAATGFAVASVARALLRTS